MLWFLEKERTYQCGIPKMDANSVSKTTQRLRMNQNGVRQQKWPLPFSSRDVSSRNKCTSFSLGGNYSRILNGGWSPGTTRQVGKRLALAIGFEWPQRLNHRPINKTQRITRGYIHCCCPKKDWWIGYARYFKQWLGLHLCCFDPPLLHIHNESGHRLCGNLQDTVVLCTGVGLESIVNKKQNS